jgi:hypothetical protein
MALPRARAVVLAAACAVAAASCGQSSEKPDPSQVGGATAEQAVAAAGLSGVTVGADTLANTRIGGPYGTALAFRFRSGWTGVVRAVRFYAVLNSDGRDGYSGGNGGRLRVALTNDSGRPHHEPRRGALASATYAPPSRDAWPLVRFARPAAVVAGRYYHVVFTNTARDPHKNYISVNALLAQDSHERAPRPPDGMAVQLGVTSDGGRTPRGWETRAERPGERYAPILEVVGGRAGQDLGFGYMEVWSGNPKPIGGSEGVRQLLGPMPGTTITGAWLRVRRRAGATAPLRVRIDRAAGGILGSGDVAASDVASGEPRWVHVRFASPVVVAQDAGDLALATEARDANAYEAFPIRKGTEFGFSPRTVFTGGYAQFTDHGSWVGWDQWGGHDERNGDLQFRLDVASG